MSVNRPTHGQYSFWTKNDTTNTKKRSSRQNNRLNILILMMLLYQLPHLDLQDFVPWRLFNGIFSVYNCSIIVWNWTAPLARVWCFLIIFTRWTWKFWKTRLFVFFFGIHLKTRRVRIKWNCWMFSPKNLWPFFMKISAWNNFFDFVFLMFQWSCIFKWIYAKCEIIVKARPTRRKPSPTRRWISTKVQLWLGYATWTAYSG